MEKTKKVILGALFLGAFLVWNSSSSSAAEINLPAPPPGKAFKVLKSTAESTVVSNVSILDAGFSKKEGSELNVFFTLSNGEGVQPGVKWGIELRTVEKGALVDQMIYPEAMTLGENSSIKKEVAYTLPEYLEGKFEIWVVAGSDQGLFLGRTSAGKIDLSGDQKFIEISECALNISGDQKSYPLSQVVDVSPEEELTLVCEANNLMDADAFLIPRIKTNRQTDFGQIFSEEYGQPVQFKKGSQKLNLVIPRAETPQAYPVSVSFSDDSGKTKSNLTKFQYVLRGNSASLRNITLNREVFGKGDVVQAALFWGGRADNFWGARQPFNIQEKIVLKIAMLKSGNQACAQVFSKEIDFSKAVEKIDIAIEEDCQDGKMIASLLDEKGEILDEKVIEFQKTPGKTQLERAEKIKSPVPLPYLIAGVLFLAGLAAIFWKKRSSNIATGALMLFLILGSFLAVDRAQAVTWTVNAVDLWLCDVVTLPPPPCQYIGSFGTEFNANLSAAATCQDANLTVDGSSTRNTSQGEASLTYSANGVSDYLVYNNSDRGSKVIPVGSSTGARRVDFNGVYTVTLYSLPGGSDTYTNSGGASIGYSVDDCTLTPPPPPPPPPINGACGAAADGRSFPSAPTAGLCRLGNLRGTPFLNDAGTRWVWFCDGLNGGSSARCLAPVLDTTCVPDPSDNECFRVSNCAGQNCGEALQTVYCVDECGGSVPIVGGMCGGERCVPERIECECYDGNWKEVQP